MINTRAPDGANNDDHSCCIMLLKRGTKTCHLSMVTIALLVSMEMATIFAMTLYCDDLYRGVEETYMSPSRSALDMARDTWVCTVASSLLPRRRLGYAKLHPGMR